MDAKTYNQKLKEHDELLTQRSSELKSVIGNNVNEFGGANDEIRRTKEYLDAKNRYDMTFRFIQDFNKSVPKKIKQEAAKLRRDEKLKKSENMKIVYDVVADYYAKEPEKIEEYDNLYIVKIDGGFIICDIKRLQYSCIGDINTESKITTIEKAKEWINWINTGLEEKIFSQCGEILKDLGVINKLLSIEINGSFFYESGLDIKCTLENNLIVRIKECYVNIDLNNGEIMQSGAHYGELEL